MADVQRKRKRRRTDRFLTGMLIYICLFLVASTGVILLLRNYLGAYERSQISHYLEEYRREQQEHGLTEACLRALETADDRLQTREERVQWAEELLAEATYPKLVNLSDGEKTVYGVRSRGQQVGMLTFTAVKQKRYDLPEWRLSEEEYDFSAFLFKTSVSIPPDYRFLVNGVTLDEAYITDTSVPYDMLAECYEHFEDIPHMVHYESGPFFGNVEITVLNASGEELGPDQLDEFHFLDNCDELMQEKVGSFIPQFLEKYVFFSSDLHGLSKKYYSELYPYVFPDSILSVRLRQAFEGLGYEKPRDVKILSVETNLVSKLGTDRYLADVTYATEITGKGDPVVTQEHVRVVICDSNGKLQAEALFVE